MHVPSNHRPKRNDSSSLGALYRLRALVEHEVLVRGLSEEEAHFGA